MGADKKPCKSYRDPASRFCADGFPQCAFCWTGFDGPMPMCLKEDLPDHLFKAYLDDSGKPWRVSRGSRHQ